MLAVLPVLFGFFVMGFCDIVGISSDYAREAFGWSHTMAGFVPSMVFIWFLFFSIPVGIKMNAWGRKNTVMLSMAVTLVGMLIPLLKTDWACLVGYALLGIGNTILQVSLNPLLNNVVTDQKLLTSSLTAGQVVNLFLTPDIEIPAGSRIVVRRSGNLNRTFEYVSSGEPGVFHNHQEIFLEKAARFA